jgi:transmembrane sensor
LRESAGAWSEGMLVASDMPLGEFLGELARYRAGRISCAPEVAHLRVSGTYPLGDTERILGALQRALPIRVRFFTRYWVSVQPADA